MSGGKEVRVLVADNDVRVRSALQTLLKQEPGLMVGECSDLESLVVQSKEFNPDLVLLDWELRGRRRPLCYLRPTRPTFGPRQSSSAGGPKQSRLPLPLVPTLLSAKPIHQTGCSTRSASWYVSQEL